MRPLDRAFLYTACWTLALVLPASILAQSGEHVPPRDAQTIRTSELELPDSPGASKRQGASAPQQSSSSQSVAPASGQTGTAQTAPAQDQAQKPQRPVGTAAAEAPKVKGVTAAQPSGIAIAPAKQHRVRTIVIRTGAVLAAGAAIGTVIGLTAGTASKPPGAH